MSSVEKGTACLATVHCLAPGSAAMAGTCLATAHCLATMAQEVTVAVTSITVAVASLLHALVQLLHVASAVDP